jgi:hypothetical protein
MQQTGTGGSMKIPRKFYRPAHVAVLTSMMVLVVTCVATLVNRGLADGFVLSWLTTWLMSWPTAWATALLWGPMANKLTRLVVEEPA